MESAALLSPELFASPEALARPAGAAFPAAGGGRGPPQGFAGVLAAASDGGLPRGEDLPVGGKGLPLDAALPPEHDARLAAWLAVFDARALGLAGAGAPVAIDAPAAAVGEASVSGTAQAAVPRSQPGVGALGEPLARAVSVLEPLVARAAAADGAAPGALAAEQAALASPAGAEGTEGAQGAAGALERAAAARPLDAGARGAAAAASLAAALTDDTAAAAQHAESPGAAQLAASALRAAASGPPAALAPDAVAAPRTSAAMPPGDAGARGALPATDGAFTATPPTDALLENAVRAPAASTEVQPDASFAHRLGAERALADALRPAGGAAETAAASASGITPPHPTAAASPSAGAAPGFEHVATHANAQSLDLHDGAWNEQLSGRIRWLVDRDVGEARIKLHPADLGSLDVKISVRHEQTFVQLAASNAAARDQLEQSLPRLRELLGQMGLSLAGASVSGGQQERPAYSTHGGYAPRLPNVIGVTQDAPGAALRPSSRALDGRIDLYA